MPYLIGVFIGALLVIVECPIILIATRRTGNPATRIWRGALALFVAFTITALIIAFSIILIVHTN